MIQFNMKECDNMKIIIDGNGACSKVAHYFSEVCSIYPITPSSPMASNVDSLSHSEKNIFNTSVKVVEMQSEAGAAGAMHGALITGTLATTFTSSQGLLLMIPNMYKMAGEMLPGVIHVAARSLATHALSIFGDHQDVYATRATGFCMLASSSVIDAYYMAAIAHLSAVKGRIPFLHFFDGFRTSHELNTIDVIELDKIKDLFDYQAYNKYKDSMLNVGKNIQKGLAENEDIYFQSMEARNMDYNKIPDIVNDYMEKINQLAKTNYKPFNYYGVQDAQNIIIAMGSVNDTIKLVVDDLNKSGHKVGLVEVHLYRPFSTEYLLQAIPNTVKNIAVLDRTKEAGSIGEPLYLDVVSALKDKEFNIVGGRFGLSSKNTTPADIKSVYTMLETNLKNNFTIGIIDDVTNLSLEKDNYNINLAAQEIKIYGFGSDGMVSASKDILKIIGAYQNKFVQGYFEYDSKKSGGVTVSNLRISNKEINAPYYVTNSNVIVITKEEYFNKFDLVRDIKENGVVLINSGKTESELNSFLPGEVKRVFTDRNVKVLFVDAEALAKENNLNGKINKIIEVIILKLLGVNNALEMVSEGIKKAFVNKGEEVINNNLNAIKKASNAVKLLNVTNTTFEPKIVNEKDVFSLINQRKGNLLTVADVENLKTGTFPGGLSKNEKRNVNNLAPKWIKENCIECGQCSLVCPHAVIRPFVVGKESDGIPLLVNKEYNYIIEVSEADCTACGLCVDACPGKAGNKALEMGKVDLSRQDKVNELFEKHNNPSVFNKYTIQGSQIQKPRFEFSGACAGCGETAYIKLLTQLLQDKLVIANATGCSSIYGGSAPSTPYSIPWANSLFEDNAEFGYGMLLSYNKKREQLEEVIKKHINLVNDELKELLTEWLENKQDFEKTFDIKNKLVTKEIPNEIKNLIDYIPSRSVWAIGGDGWAYDIGFGGIDHVLSTNENIKILVLDTEVYSNTGGQSSKSSRVGQVAEFANFGKQTSKKDLFRIAMSYPNCYVASVSLGANYFQTIKAFKEAEEHNGPAIIIAYSTCVEHGIKNGMGCSLKEQKLAVECGYVNLMRYNPVEEKLYLDSKEPNFDKYQEFLDNEVRFRSLKIKDKELAEEILNNQKENSIKRYNYYKELTNK